MTGWRIGYIGGPNWIAKACNKMQGQITSGANCIAQRATIAALEAPVSNIQYMIDEFAKRRIMIIKLLGSIRIVTNTVLSLSHTKQWYHQIEKQDIRPAMLLTIVIMAC